jgi:hypothetical protein
VNNRAVRENKTGEKLLRREYNASGRIAPGGSRSKGPQHTKLNRSLPDRLLAPALKSERTIAREAPGIRSTDGSAAVCGKKKGTPMIEFKELQHFAGFDWAKDHHCVVVVNRQGEIVSKLEFPHSAEGWKDFTGQMGRLAGLALAIETSSGPAVDQLMQRGFRVFPVNPAASESYRQRKAPSGTKTDHHDAWALADALRLDGLRWKALAEADPLTLQCRRSRAPHRSASSRARSTRPGYAGRAISLCDAPCTSGRSVSGSTATGARCITGRNGRTARATPAPCAAWGNAC